MLKFCYAVLFVLQIFGGILGTVVIHPTCPPPRITTTPMQAFGYSTIHCPTDWVRFRAEKCFKLFRSIKLTSTEAENVCKQHNSHLASIHSKEELDFLNTYILRESLAEKSLLGTWIGGFKRGMFWMWVDLTPFDFTDWYPGKPTGDPPCMYLTTEDQHLNDPLRFGKMNNDGQCNYTFPFMCQKFVMDVKRIVYSQ